MGDYLGNNYRTFTPEQMADVQDALYQEQQKAATLTAERDALRAQVAVMQAENAKLLAELSGARTSVLAFGAPLMAILAQQHGLPDGHLFAAHYDILKKAGARMTSFTRAE